MNTFRLRGIPCFLCLFLAAFAVQAAQWTVYPTGQTNCTGYTDYAAKYDGEICMYGGASTGTVRKANGFAKFDLSAVPDGSSVSGIQLHFYVNTVNWPYWSVTPVDLDPVTLGATPQLLWEDIEAEKTAGYYNYQNESSSYAVGWHVLTLGGTANADLTARLADDWFTVGVASRDSSATYYQCIDGHNGPNVPYLVVFDIPPPGNDTCAGAIAIPAVPGSTSYTGDTTFAANDYDCSAPCVGGQAHGGSDVAYTVTLPAGCEICVTLNQSELSWNGAVYMVTDCGDVNGTCVAGASGWLAGSQDETFCFSNTATETYYIIVDGRTGGGAGQFQMDVGISCLTGPTGLSCTETVQGVDLTWTNNDLYDLIEIYVDGALDTVVAGSDTFAFIVPEIGYHCIYICGVAGSDSSCSDTCCLIFGYNFDELLWDFEADDGGFVVQGTGAWEWGVATYGPCSETAMGRVWATALHAEYSPNACWLLDSQPFNLAMAGAFLSIDHCYDAEFTYDGGVVWFTTDDFWYNTSEPVKGADAVISGMPPLCSWVEGQRGFTGSSGGWVTDSWDLTGDMWKNQSVTLRFAFAADSSITAPGWMIDNITLYINFSKPLDCDYTVTPTSGTVPFQVLHRLTLYNNMIGGAVLTRRIAARIAVTIGNGTTYNPWRAGFTNIAPSSSYFTQFTLNIPALATVIGNNTFVMSAMDVTPAPYNQPPYPPSGQTETRARVVVANTP